MKEKKREITQEEQKVLQHIAAGYTDHEIAEKMIEKKKGAANDR